MWKPPQVSICKPTSGKGEIQLANFVRLKGTESAIVKVLTLIPRIKKKVQEEKKELEEKP